MVKYGIKWKLMQTLEKMSLRDSADLNTEQLDRRFTSRLTLLNRMFLSSLIHSAVSVRECVSLSTLPPINNAKWLRKKMCWVFLLMHPHLRNHLSEGSCPPLQMLTCGSMQYAVVEEVFLSFIYHLLCSIHTTEWKRSCILKSFSLKIKIL